LRLKTKNVGKGGERDGILIHSGWSYSFTEGCILTINPPNLQKIINNPEAFLQMQYITGSVSKIESYESGHKTKITLLPTNPRDTSNISKCPTIIFTGFPAYTAYNDTFKIEKILNNKDIIIDKKYTVITDVPRNSDMSDATFTAPYNNTLGSNWTYSAPAIMSLYDYVEKHVPNGTIKGKIIISEDGETVNQFQHIDPNITIEFLSEWLGSPDM
jgi:hypothetical protein